MLRLQLQLISMLSLFQLAFVLLELNLHQLVLLHHTLQPLHRVIELTLRVLVHLLQGLYVFSGRVLISRAPCLKLLLLSQQLLLQVRLDSVGLSLSVL